MLRVSVLASSSKGNSTFVEMDGIRLLVDAGISTRRIVSGLSEIGVDPESLDGVLITHEHIDHVKGLPTFLRRYHLPVFSREETLGAIAKKDELPADCLQPVDKGVSFGRVYAEMFKISHDAVSPVGFQILGSSKCTFATDLGFVSESVQNAMDGSDVLILEANHDTEMLRAGSYPWTTKRRILSNCGHLSNNEAAWALVRMKKRPKKVFLAHLSEKNNRPELAVSTLREILVKQGIGLSDIELTLTAPDRTVSL